MSVLFAPLRPGARVGSYELAERLGSGAAGAVYRAKHQRLARDVAVKVLGAGARATPEARRRFATEAQAVARLRHPHIIPIHDVGEQDGVPFLVMELVPGGTLAQRLERGWPTATEIALLVFKLAQALVHAHERGILHRDIKPANILMGEGGEPILTDFGLAKDLDESRTGVTQAGRFLGTPAYWPPEQAKGELEALGPHSDVYSLGATFYELLAGKPPHSGETIIEIMAAAAAPIPPPSSEVEGVDPVLQALCMRCLEKAPARRPTAVALAEELAAYLADGTASQLRPSRAAQGVDAVRRAAWASRSLALGAGVGLLVGWGATAAWYTGELVRLRKRNLELSEQRAREAERLLQGGGRR